MYTFQLSNIYWLMEILWDEISETLDLLMNNIGSPINKLVRTVEYEAICNASVFVTGFINSLQLFRAIWSEEERTHTRTSSLRNSLAFPRSRAERRAHANCSQFACAH